MEDQFPNIRKGETMAYWLIKGTQRDGDHEYSQHSVMESGVKPTHEQAQALLVQDHAFGYIEDDEEHLYEKDFLENFKYGDGMTCIMLDSIERITKEQIDVLRKLRIY